ncbi:CLUMA_CG014699, isoform A [Clunio marinus]|uniref:CLUMA_CG014699, isoform A n=1 Tax=Clunio marinus TaxID=568069 RepID=A0A1J1ILG0_9DIPT|nr:CLUMA_CG014699, isoform A [Clunio marinus]
MTTYKLINIKFHSFLLTLLGIINLVAVAIVVKEILTLCVTTNKMLTQDTHFTIKSHYTHTYHWTFTNCCSKETKKNQQNNQKYFST